MRKTGDSDRFRRAPRAVVAALATLALACGCGAGPCRGPSPRGSAEGARGGGEPVAVTGFREDRVGERRAMVEAQLRGRDIVHPAVLAAMGKVPRHLFVPEGFRREAYGDHPLPIGLGQTISQPYIVAFMTQALDPRPGMRVLEVGTGSGYQAAVLAEVVGPSGAVFTVEILEDLARRASETLLSLGYGHVLVRAGDGFDGWPEHAPYDAVVLTAAPADIPAPLLDQLAVGGVLVAPVGEGVQDLVRVTRTPEGFRREVLLGVRFVPMTGKARRR